MSKLKEILHEKRKATENRIRQLEREGKQGIRYTAMMPDIPFMVLGLLSDIGWMIHLAAGIIYFCKNGIRCAADCAALIPMIAVISGVAYLIYLNKIHEKEIAAKHQKDIGFGMTAYSGLAGAVIAIFQIAVSGVSAELVCIIIGGLLNLAAGLPIYLSFKKGIFYGVK